MARFAGWTLDPFEPGQLLSPAARLLGALSRAVLADVLLRPRDLLGLAPRRTGGGGLPVRALPHVVRVRAAVLDDGPALERERARGHAVQEPPVMGDDQDRRIALEEEALQPLQRRDVEMVRRLVQQQQVRIVEQEPR